MEDEKDAQGQKTARQRLVSSWGDVKKVPLRNCKLSAKKKNHKRVNRDEKIDG